MTEQDFHKPKTVKKYFFALEKIVLMCYILC